MGEKTNISWCDSTWNPWIGCTKVSAACDNCYAETLTKRYGWAKWGAGELRARTSTANWRKPIAWNKAAAAAGVRRRVFCASLADVFDAEVDAAWREELMEMIEVTDQLDWLLLTKRPQVAKKFFTDRPVPDNVWLGTTVEDQKMANLRIPILLSIDAKVRFLSCEPLLGPIELRGQVFPESVGHRGNALEGLPMPGSAWSKIDWVIAGGESGAHARGMPLDWARSLRDQCTAAKVAFFMKQLSQPAGKHFKDFAAFPADLQIREFPEAVRAQEG